jgi:hypothetical protein
VLLIFWDEFFFDEGKSGFAAGMTAREGHLWRRPGTERIGRPPVNSKSTAQEAADVFAGIREANPTRTPVFKQMICA